MQDRYKSRGVSAQKEDVHAAIKDRDKGLFPGAFSQVFPDLLTHSPDHCLIQHADGAGTKSSLAYLCYLETQDTSVFSGLAQDALVMNTDDALCVGCTGPFVATNTIGRNAKKIPGSIIKAIIQGYDDVAQMLQKHGVTLINVGGETADLGDLVRTIIMDATITARMPRSEIINCEDVKPGHVIVGFASYGKASYETTYNSGMGSNGLTLSRHELLHPDYRKITESFAPEIEEVAYTGRFRVTDSLPGTPLTIGQALLSPTRTYLPVMNEILNKFRSDISGIFHNTGGGQTKCLHFGKQIHYVKDNLLPIPPLFQLLKEETSLTPHELFQSFNMGCRLEIVCDPKVAQAIIDHAQSFMIDAQQIGYVEKSSAEKNQLSLKTSYGNLNY